MELFVFGVLALAFLASPVILLVWQLLHRDRLNKLDRSLGALKDGYEGRLDALDARLRALERGLGGEVSSIAAPVEDAPAVVSPVVAAEAEVDESERSADLHEPSPIAPVEEPVPVASDPVSTSSSDAKAAPAPARRTNADWEEMIGGSWLNKVGVVVLIVGIVLLLGYSMTHLGPAGRVGLGLAVSAVMLGGGALLEGRERYRMVARGLIGGGWAGFYSTTFAMHGVEAARIIESPVAGTALLLAVAVGMVLHSMAYRSETVTALAYFVTFVTLGITPASRFALMASVPLAASLLYLGRRLMWPQMMVAGVVFTYGAYLVRVLSPTVSSDDWFFGQALLFVYWTMFEASDLLSLRRRKPGGIDETLFLVNAAGFFFASLLVWNDARPETLWVLFFITAAAYTVSALLRASLLGVVGDDEDITVGARLLGGGYESTSMFAAALLVLGIGERLDGWQQNVAWLMQSQLIMLSGLTLRLRFLRLLGSFVLVAPVFGVVLEDLPSSRTVVALGRTWLQSTPTALLTAAVLYLDRVFVRRASGVVVTGLEHLYNWVGTFLIAAVLANELPETWVAPAWLVLGLLLIGYSRGHAASEIYLQGYLLAAVAWFAAVVFNVPTNDVVWGLQARWVTALPMVPAFYGLAYMHRAALMRVARDTGSLKGLHGLVERLDLGAAVTMSIGATFLTSWFLLFEVSGRWLTVAWGLQGVVLLAIGIALAARGMRVSGLALLVTCVAKVFFYDINELETIFKIISFLILGSLLIGVSLAYSRYREQIRRLL